MKSLFDASVHQEIQDRLEKINVDTIPNWGKMNAGQMAWHCQYPLKLAIANENLGVKGNPFIRWFFKKSLYNDKPWRKNLPTAKFLVAKEDKDFSKEMGELRKLVTDFHNVKDRTHWNPHPFFGHFTHDQWGQLEYKHLDHHLRQFGT